MPDQRMVITVTIIHQKVTLQNDSGTSVPLTIWTAAEGKISALVRGNQDTTGLPSTGTRMVAPSIKLK